MGLRRSFGYCAWRITRRDYFQVSTTVTGGNGIDITVGSGNPSAPFNVAVDMGEFFNVGPELTSGIRSAGYDPRYLDAYAAEENYTNNSGVIQNVGQTTTGASELLVSM